MATKAKGIKVKELADELGIQHKLILQKLKDEGMGDKARNSSSTLSYGLAQTVRDWHAAGDLGAAAPAAEVAQTAVAVEEPPAKPKSRRKTAKKEEEAPAEAVAAPAEAPGAVATPAAPEAAPAVTSPSPVEVEAPAPPVEAPVVAEAAAAAPVVEAPTEAHKAHTAHKPARKTPAAPAKPAVIPAPKMLAPAPAKIQGPRIVREEAPEVLPTPRPRRVSSGPTSGTVQARPQGGRGVKVTTKDEEVDDAEALKKKGKSGRTLSSRRRGPDGRRGDAIEKLREYTDADLLERQERLQNAERYRLGFDSDLRKKSERGTHLVAKTAVQRGGGLELEEPITVKGLSAALGVKSSEILLKLMKQGVMANINQSLDREVAGALALDYGLELKIKAQPTLEEQLEAEYVSRQPQQLLSRAPVVTILGHVDHGKTSLLDKIRNSNVAAGEAGGITQHTAAWMVEVVQGEGRKRVTFIDTPGHQAFTAMRARGAAVTDVVVLVVSAAEGVQPQTVESINHARAAEVPIVVAMNKIDRADANEQMVLGQLAAQGLNPTEWGGDTEVVRTSAVTGQGISDLIEILDYQSQLLELKADPSAPARGMVIESFVDEGLGPVATVLVQDGTLRVGDVVLAGAGYGRVRTMLNDRRKPVTEAGPAMPVIVSGLDEMPSAGDKFYVTGDVERARAITEDRRMRQRQEQLAGRSRVTRDNLLETMAEQASKTINLIIKADVQGSVETLVNSVTGQNTEEVKVRVIHSGVGAINESDVELAMATKAKPTDNRVAIIGFNVVADDQARALAEQNNIDVKLYQVIYEIFDDLKKALSGLLEPEIREKFHGRIEVRQVFRVPRVGMVAGCMVTQGHVQRGSKIRLIRNGAIVTQDLAIDSLRRVKEDVKEVKQGFECGIKLAGYDDVKIGDVLEAYVRETIERTL